MIPGTFFKASFAVLDLIALINLAVELLGSPALIAAEETALSRWLWTYPFVMAPMIAVPNAPPIDRAV